MLGTANKEKEREKLRRKEEKADFTQRGGGKKRGRKKQILHFVLNVKGILRWKI